MTPPSYVMPMMLVPVTMGRVVRWLDAMLVPVCNAVDVLIRDGVEKQLMGIANKTRSGSRNVDDSDDCKTHINERGEKSSSVGNDSELPTVTLFSVARGSR
mmetsp:Transcript_26094/g.55917  ORF Transcript_26094/g.55917 Transcript_26094/m.55917 type:complete len:101 (-) Transcript_26094:16-318(-)